MTKKEFIEEIVFIHSQLPFKFPKVAVESLWPEVKTIEHGLARQGTIAMFRQRSYYSIEMIGKFWNAEAQRVESSSERYRAAQRQEEMVFVNDDVMRDELAKVNRLLHGVGDIPTKEQTGKQIDAVRDNLKLQAEKLVKDGL